MNEYIFLPENSGKVVKVWLSVDKGRNLIINAERTIDGVTDRYSSPIGKVTPKPVDKNYVV
jgi:hypothetical protein